MKQTITIRISDTLKRELKELSRYENKPVSDIIRDSLRNYVAIHRFRKLGNMTLPFAESQGILTDEDVYKEIS